MATEIDLVPEVSSLPEIYLTSDHAPRYRKLFKMFKESYGEYPDFVTRSPGRVNLIGEHIDYCYFSVLPMAIEGDIVILVSKNDSRKINLLNGDTKFKQESFALPADGALVSIDPTVTTWANYFKCGYLVAHQYLSESRPSFKLPAGMDVLVDGTVPAAAGLSSSAAFICAAALATLRANGITSVSKEQLTTLAIVSERHLGVFSGGMDQSASVFGKRDHALYVQFQPQLKCTPFKFPDTEPQLTFLVANSLVTANKHETAPVNYNLRVVEVSIAAEILAHKYSVSIVQDSGIGTGTLRGFMEAYYKEYEGALPWDGEVLEGTIRLKQMAKLVRTVFSQMDGYTAAEAAEELHITVDQLQERFLSKTPVRFEKLKLYSRALHVYEESLRVLQYLTLLLHPPVDSVSLFHDLGQLMNKSHDSLRALYNCSCKELDEICEIARSSGSYGSRVTGAGFGGCSVHLVTSQTVQDVKKALIERYYRVRFPDITDAALEDALVISKPGIGSLVYTGGMP
ncbi:ribosomal protein S5 domain 2-type protein [Lipomyces chichibuensis]|uniref:ribosomal protein S5 domain 2-type protein n=1 Tax=Lipomyces chichibuensis TaxID=1546026 RepID=UPI003343CB84